MEIACLKRILGQICSAETLNLYFSHAYVLQSLTVTTLFCKVAVANWCGAVQLSSSSSAAEEVVNQLGHWGNYHLMRLFVQGLQAVLRAGGAACSDGLPAQVDFWLSARASLAQVSVNMKCQKLLSLFNQACLYDHKLPLARHSSHHTCHSCMICTAMGVSSGGKSYYAASIARHVMHMPASLTTLLSCYAGHSTHAKYI